MFTRIWQHRYYGLLATLLLGLAAAVLVMLLPDRQQAFARFMVNPAIADGQLGPQTLMGDQRLVDRVLQRLEIESPNLIDPRPVDPLTGFQRNFALRSTGTPGEFEISYVSRSPEQAAEGVKTWLSVASDVWREEGPADAPVPGTGGETAGVQLAEISAANAAVANARDRQQALTLEQSQLNTQLAAAKAAKARFESDRARAATAVASARETRDAQRATQFPGAVAQSKADLDDAEKKLSALGESLARTTAQAKQAAARLAQVEQAQAQTGKALASAQAAMQTAQAAKTDFAQAGDEREQSIELARTALANRQRAVIEKDLKQALERSATLERELARTSATIVEVVTEKSPISQAGDYASRQRLLEKTKTELGELRVRFTDNHPDVRRQLAILSELEAPGGENSVIEAPTVGARPQVRPNPQHAILSEALEQNQSQVVVLRQRVGEMNSQRTKSAALTAAGQENQAQIAQAQRTLSLAQAAATSAEKDLQAAQKNAADSQAAQRNASNALKSAEGDVASKRSQLASAEQAQQEAQAGSSAPGNKQTASELASLEKERGALEDKIEDVEKSLASVQLALSEAGQQSSQAAKLLATLQKKADENQAGDSQGGKTQALGIARGGMTLVQSTQVVPASSNPNRTRFLFFGLLASLVFGTLVALALGLRRTAFSSVAELEQITGLRALGGVPRFSTSRRTMGFWLSAALFVLLILIYGLVYFGFISLVESGANLLAPDLAAWRDAGLGLLRNGAIKIGVGEQWLDSLAGLVENR